LIEHHRHEANPAASVGTASIFVIVTGLSLLLLAMFCDDRITQANAAECALELRFESRHKAGRFGDNSNLWLEARGSCSLILVL